MYRCKRCTGSFEEPKTKETTYESYYGVSDLFPNSTPMTYDVCPLCGSEEGIYEYNQLEIEDKNELIDMIAYELDIDDSKTNPEYKELVDDIKNNRNLDSYINKLLINAEHRDRDEVNSCIDCLRGEI